MCTVAQQTIYWNTCKDVLGVEHGFSRTRNRMYCLFWGICWSKTLAMSPFVLQKCIQELTNGSKLQCPMCKSFCDVDQIVHDFQTERFVQAFKELEEEFNRKLERATAASAYPEPSAPPEHTITALKKCELCSSNDIAFWCVECKQWLCIPCKKIHLKTSFAKDHHIEKLSVKNKGVKSLLQSEIDSLKVKINDFHRYINKLQAEKTGSSTGCKGRKGPGQLNCPFICATDAAGATPIADCGNYRMQLLRSNGKWSIVHLLPPV